MESEADVITATAGVFSGRRNPEIVLSGTDASSFAERVRETLGKDPIHPPPPPKLGSYYGFQIHASKQLAKDRGIPEDFNIYSGVITEQNGREQRHWRDVGGVEDFLLGIAYERGHRELLDKVNAPQPRAATR
jgi:hypothetical protein